MGAQTDFAITIKRAAGLTLDATCSARAAQRGLIPEPHRRLLGSAIVALETAQQAIFDADQEPWPPPKPQPPL